MFDSTLKLLALLLLISGCATSRADPLATGVSLAETRYKDWTYGSDAASKQVDCVQFLLAIIEEELQIKLTDEIRRAILLNYGWSAAETQLYVQRGYDPRLGGAQYSLVQLAHKGKTIHPTKAQAGDIIQYWMKKADGTWFGHSGIISSVNGTSARIFGAHLSQNKIADSDFELDLLGKDRRIYIARIIPESFSLKAYSVATFAPQHVNDPVYHTYGRFYIQGDDVGLGTVFPRTSEVYTMANEAGVSSHNIVSELNYAEGLSPWAMAFLQIDLKDAAFDTESLAPGDFDIEDLVAPKLAMKLMALHRWDTPQTFRVIPFDVPKLSKNRMTASGAGNWNDQLKEALKKFEALVRGYPGATFKITSGVRSAEYQAYLYEMKTVFKQFQKVPGIESRIAGNRPQLSDPKLVLGIISSAMLKELNARIESHQLTPATDGSPAVNPPGASNHESGNAVDVRITGLSQTQKHEAAMKAGLWRPYYNAETGSEEMHYEVGASTPKANIRITMKPKTDTLQKSDGTVNAAVAAQLPGRLLVYTDAGLRIGYDPVANAEIDAWPGADYSGMDSQVQTIFLPPMSDKEFAGVKFLFSGDGLQHVDISAARIIMGVEGRSVSESSPFNVTTLFSGAPSAGQLPITAKFPNFAPVAFPDGIYELSDNLPIAVNPLANDRDANEDELTLVSFTQPVHGTVVAENGSLVYAPPDDYWGLDTFEYVVGDSNGGQATASVTFRVPFHRPSKAVTESILRQGAPVVGYQGSTGHIVQKIGTPVIDDERRFAVRLSVSQGTRKEKSALFVAGDTPWTLIAGDRAPMLDGAPLFKSFGDPIMTSGGGVAFIAGLSGYSVKGSENEAVWTDAFSPGIMPILQKGKPIGAEGIELAVTDKVLQIAPWRDGILALVHLKNGAGGVTSRNDDALLYVSSFGTSLFLREGTPIPGDGRLVTRIAALLPALGSNGHGRTAGSKLSVRVSFSDGSQAVVAIGGGDSTRIVLDTSGIPPTSMGTGLKWRSFGFPSASPNSEHVILVAQLQSGYGKVSKKDDHAVVLGGDEEFQLIAREGGAAVGIPAAYFKKFLDPVMGASGTAAFLGELTGRDVSARNNVALWVHRDGEVALLARKGGPVVDRDGNPIVDTTFSQFKSLAYPPGDDLGPVFLAKVSGKNVNRTNNAGLWGVSSEGKLIELVRHGDVVTVDGQPKTIASMTLLNSLSRVSGASRSFNAVGSIIMQVLFTDRSQGILRVDIP